MEQYYMDNRTYDNAGKCGVADPADTNDAAFTVACSGSSATAYTVKATGKTSKGMKDFVYEINQAGAKKTSAARRSGWTTSGTCWVTQRDGLLTMRPSLRPAGSKGHQPHRADDHDRPVVILSLMAFPMFTTWIASQQVRTATEAVLDGLRATQAEPVKRNAPVRFVLTTGTGWQAQLVSDDSVVKEALFSEAR
jgi:hypothetical protein